MRRDAQIGQQVKAMRTRTGWSLEAVARRLGVSYATVSRWERNKSKPSPLARERLMALIAESKGAVK